MSVRIFISAGRRYLKHTYVEDEKGVFRVHDLGRTVSRNFCNFLVPPLVPSFDHRNLVSRSFEHQDVFDIWAFLERRINDSLGRDRLAASLSLVGRDDNSTATIIGTVSQGFGRETSKDGGVDGTDSGTCEECCSGLPNHAIGVRVVPFSMLSTYQVMGK